MATDLLGDRAYAAVPLTTRDADELVDGPRAAPLLHGYGGAAPAEPAALRMLALRLSALSDALPEVTEAVLTATAGPESAAVRSADIWVGPPNARRDDGPRRLRGL